MSFDIDLDFGNRVDILKHISFIKCMTIVNEKRTHHNSGIYVTDAPVDPVTNLCTFTYKDAEDMGYFKLDFLNNSLYTKIECLKQLECLTNAEPNWKMLYDKTVVEQLVHIGTYYELILKLPEPIISVDHLAMFLALIRPGKRHLLGKKWSDIKEGIWEKDEHSGYSYKKSHSFAFALSIVVQMNLLTEYNKNG